MASKLAATPVSKRTPIVFFCSPSLGILDSWLPIIYELSRQPDMFEIIFLVPRFSILRQLTPSNPLVRFSESIFSKVVCIDSFGCSRIFSSFSSAYQWYTTSIPNHSILLIKRIYFRVSSVIPRFIINQLHRLINSFFFNNFLKGSFLDHSVLLYDVYEESKLSNSWFFENISFSYKFSLFHGIDIPSLPCSSQTTHKIDSSTLLCFLYSKYEIPYYTNHLHIPLSCLDVIGIPRHDPHWFNLLTSDSLPDHNSRDSVVLFSRPISDYLPKQRKIEALQSLKKCLIDDHKLFLFVKKHPKEINEGLFELVFDSKMRGLTWDYSDLHPSSFARYCKFSCVFYSNLCIDMIPLNIPTIEYLNLRGIEPYSHSDYPHISDQPVLSYRLHGFVYGVSTYDELVETVDMILDSNIDSMKPLIYQYCKYFNKDSATSEKVASIISSVVC